MGNAAAIWLIDLQARDGNGSGLARQQHAELAEVAVGAVGRQIDDREALHVGA